MSLSQTDDVKPGLAKLWRLIVSTSEDTLALGRLFPFELKVPESLGVGHEAVAFKVDLLAALRPSVSLSQPFKTSRLTSIRMPMARRRRREAHDCPKWSMRN